MHKVLKAFPCSFDGIGSVNLKVGDERDFGSMADGLKKAGLIGELSEPGMPRKDGPTVEEWVKAGYLASNYPPDGYASRSTAKEITAAVKAEKAQAEAERLAAEETARAAEEQKAKKERQARDALLADLGKHSDEELAKIVADEKIAIDVGDDRNAIIAKIVDARAAAAQAGASE